MYNLPADKYVSFYFFFNIVLVPSGVFRVFFKKGGSQKPNILSCNDNKGTQIYAILLNTYFTNKYIRGYIVLFKEKIAILCLLFCPTTVTFI